MTAHAPRELKGFRLHERIGAGGFGEVFRATQTSVGRDVAIKVVLPQLANDPDFVRRFEIEAQLVASLEHPHITPLYDYWRDPDGAYLVMRYYPRGSLADALTDGALAPTRTAQLLDQLASAVDLAHEHGIVHRDIKPSNVLLDDHGNAYLSDFGIAKSSRPEGDGLTREGAMVGSPDYLAPEQAKGESVGAASDVYSLGVLLHELLSGRHPFYESSPLERLARHLHDPLPPLETLSEPLRGAADAVVQRATAKNATERYRSAGELARAFRHALREARAGSGVGEATPSDSDGTEGSTESVVSGVRDVTNPFVGLRAFRASDAEHFHGRERLVDELIERFGDPDNRLLALVGPSGSGKSSVLHAGVLPALRRGALPGSEAWFVTDLVPSARPLDELEVALTRVAIQAAPSLRDHLARDEHGLGRISRIILPDDGSELVLAIDQFEELFTLCDDDAMRKHVLNLLHAAVTDPRSRVRVLLTLRADFFDRPLQYQPFADLVRSRIATIVPMNDDELERAIVKPARDVGLSFQDELVRAMIDQVRNQPGALPLLQFALTRLFEERDGDRLTLEAFDRIGGVAGALARRADDVYERLSDDGKAATRQLTLRLVALGDGSEDTRRRALRSELHSVADDPESMMRVIDKLAAERLLTLDRDPSTREPTVELAHEALLREWTRLRSWIDDSRADVRMQRQLFQLASAWDAGDRDASFLLRGLRLQQFDAWRRETDVGLSPLETDFLDAGLEEREREREVEAARQARAEALRRRARTFLNAFVVVLLVATVASGALGFWANRQRVAAEQQRQAAVAAEASAQEQAAILLAAQADAEAEDGDTDEAILLALAALENYPYTPEAERALASAVAQNRALQRYAGHETAIPGVAWSPDGELVASVGQDNVVHVWSATTTERVSILEQPDGITANVLDMALAAAFALDGRHLYVLLGDRFLLGSQDYHLARWDLEAEELVDLVPVANEAIPDAGVSTVASARKYWTGDGLHVGRLDGRVASLAGDDTAAVWNADLSRRVLTLEGHDDAVATVRWSPDQRFLLTASYDGTARIWNAEDGSLVRTFAVDGRALNAAIWSPDGTQIATGGNEGVVRRWSVADGTIDGEISFAPLRVQTLAWSHRTIAVGSEDDVVRLVNADYDLIDAQLAGHENEVHHARWSPDGETLATTSSDATVRLWTRLPSSTVYEIPIYGVGNVAWSADTTRLVVPYGSIDSTVDIDVDGLALLDGETGEILSMDIDTTGKGHFFHADYSPTDDRVIAGGLDVFPDSLFEGDPVPMYDASTGAFLTEFAMSNGAGTRNMYFSPDGTRIAIGSIDGRLDIRNADSLELIAGGQHGEDFLTDLAWSPNGEYIITFGDDGTAKLWDAETAEGLNLFRVADLLAWAVEWSPDSTKAVFAAGTAEGLEGSGGALRVFDPFTGEMLLDITGHAGDVTFAAWSPDGRRIASVGVDDTVRLWDAETGVELMRAPANVAFFGHLEWAPDRNWISVGSDRLPPASRVLRVWTSTEELVEYTMECCVFRELSDAERRQYGLDVTSTEAQQP